MNAFVFRICLASALIAVAFADIPSYIKTCKRNDPDANKCITNSIEQLRDKLRTGIPELDVPSIEPLLLKNLRLTRGPNSASLDLNLTDIEVYGPSTFKIDDLNVDTNKLLFTYTVKFDKLEFRGKYSINAKILLLQLNGVGNVTGYLQNYGGKTYMKAKKIRRNNNTYLQFDKMKLVIRIAETHINFDNLFNGDKVLGQATNELLNENSNLVTQEITPLLEDSLANLFTNVANKITQTFTYDELFPID
ncbi:protein takeout-like [Odontomachus brunneus]|uniref:protein takeout-like n=1 Tax=Odontomachus brunneus TaxID=486640 RepID=UPI0013F20234|nr:protein takeout-like [Odontomachus brunneus]